MKRVLLTLMAATLMTASAHAGSPKEAQQFVDGVSRQVLEVIKTNDSEAVKLGKLETIFSGAVDIPFVGKYVLAKHWRVASDEQKAAYLAAYQPFVIKNYAGKLTKYSGQQYTLKNPRAAGSQYIVTMEIIDPGNPSIFVDYRLRDTDGAYKVIDISVEGVSLVATQRSEFNSIVSSKGLDYLIAALQKQVAKK